MVLQSGRNGLVVLLTLALASPLAAQGGLSLKGGLTFAGATNGPDWSAKAGWMVGGDYEVLLAGKVLGLVPGAYYQVRSGEATVGGATTKVTLKDIHVPLVLKVNVPLVVVTPYAVGGGYYNFSLKCETETAECDDRTNDYGALLGAGVAIGGGFLVEARYLWGAASYKDVRAGVEDFKLGTFTFLLGLRF